MRTAALDHTEDRARATARRAAAKALRAVTVLAAPRYVDLAGPCLVLAPHPDDESIGCGGTIAAKRAKGLRVVVAIATDGALSDAQAREPAEVVAVREREALAACAELSVTAEDVRFLRFPDGALAEHHDALVREIERLVGEVRADEVLVSSAMDPHPDHQALRRAVAGADLPGAIVREYLVWAWPSWPLSAWRMHATAIGGRPSVRSLARLVRRGRRRSITSVRARKAAAIARYESQVGDGRAGRGVPPRMLAEFAGRAELLLAGEDERSALDGAWQAAIGPGSRPRSWLREHAPALRSVVLAPRRAVHRRRWARRHVELSQADRAVLTGQILPAVRAAAGGADVLFVGVGWYTAGYPAMFPDGNLVTMDLDPALATHGAPRHVVGDVRDLGTHFDADCFAAIVCNGVLGYGVDSPDDVRRALDAMRACLTPGGWLVIGWNDIDGRRIPDLVPTARDVGLEPTVGAGLSAPRTEPIGPLRHVYDVYRRADPRVGAGSD